MKKILIIAASVFLSMNVFALDVTCSGSNHAVEVSGNTMNISGTYRGTVSNAKIEQFFNTIVSGNASGGNIEFAKLEVESGVLTIYPNSGSVKSVSVSCK